MKNNIKCKILNAKCKSFGPAIVLHFLFFTLHFTFLSAQTPAIDSFKTALANAKEDTTKINLLNKLGWELMYQNPDTSILLGKKALEILTVIESEERAKQSPELSSTIQKLIANTNSNLGVYYTVKGDYPLSLSYHFKALEKRKQLNAQKGIAASLNNIGNVYRNQGDYPNALKYFFEALEIDKELGNKNGIAVKLGNIGIVYWNQGDYSNALKYFFDALEIDKELGNKNGIARHLGSIGNVYAGQGDYPNALNYLFEALEIEKELGNKNGIAANLGNIGIVYAEQGDYPNALKYFFEALEIDKELGNKNGMAAVLGNIGSLYSKQGLFKEAEMYLDSALAIDTTIGILDHTRNTYLQLSQLYDTTGNWQLAYQHYKKYSAAKDSLFNEEKSKEIGRLEQSHEFEMAEMEREQKEEEKSRQYAAAVGRRNLLQYSGIILCLAGLFICIFLFARRFKKIKEEKNYEKYVKLIEVILFVSFFIFFEFILVLLDPHLEKLTGGQPAYKLLVNAILASVIFPLHSILEAKLKASVLKSEVVSHKSGGGGSKTLLLLVGFVFISLFNASFLDKADSLKTALANAKEDTAKVNLLNSLGWELMYQNPDTSILLSKQALSILTVIASEERAWQSPELNPSIQKLIANSNSNLGVYYWLKGDYPLSLSYHLKALELRMQLNDKKDIAASLGNIGLVYRNQGDYPNALKYFFKSLEIDKELGNKKGLANQLGNIGTVYYAQGGYPNALKYYFEALEINKERGNKNGMAINLGNIGSVYAGQGDYPNALIYYFETLEIDKELGNKNGMAIRLSNIGTLYTQIGRFKEAEVYLDSALVISNSIGYLLHIKYCYEALSQLYDTTGNWQLAYQHYKKYSAAKDSLFNEEKSKEIGRLEQSHEFEMAEMEREQKEEEKSRQYAAAVGRRNLLQYSGIFLILFFMFGVVFFLGRISLPEWMVELSTFVPFMVLFEFILVLLDPYLESYTGGEPLYKLLVNAVCAMILFPIHSFFEKKLKARIYKIKREKAEKYAEEFRKKVDEFMD